MSKSGQKLIKAAKQAVEMASNMTDIRGLETQVKDIGRVGSFAPGNYACKCSQCKTWFVGDKRSTSCLTCVVNVLVAHSEET